jgi:hypothetical protein
MLLKEEKIKNANNWVKKPELIDLKKKYRLVIKIMAQNKENGKLPQNPQKAYPVILNLGFGPPDVPGPYTIYINSPGIFPT